MQVFVFLLQDRMCNFSKKIRQRKNVYQSGIWTFEAVMGIAWLLYSFFPNVQDMHKIIVLSSICNICATLYRSMSIFRTPIGDENLFELLRVIRV